MVNRVWVLSAVLLAIAAGGLALFGSAQPGSAQADAANLQGVFIELTDEGKLFTIEFMQPVARLGKSTDIGTGRGVRVNQIGDDMVCFTVPGTNINQISCVPYNNIASVFYSE